MLLRAEGLSFDHPHFSSGNHNRRRRVRRRLTVSLCADPRGAGRMHRITLFGYDDEGRRALEAIGLSLRPAYRGSDGLALRDHPSPTSDVWSNVWKTSRLRSTCPFASRPDSPLRERLRQGRNSLPFMPASVGPARGWSCFPTTGASTPSRASSESTLDRPVYDLDIERTHNFIANGIVTHNSIYGFRGADINNILDFERDFPGAQSIALEQNYRSTNAILGAANSVIENNRDRKPKRLFSDLGEGEPVQVVEVEDEHTEARFVAAEIARLVESGWSAAEIAVFYRTNAQSRVLEDVLVRQQVPYQVIGGPRFYERAEIKDAMAYLSVIHNPNDAVALLRIANRPRRGIGDTSLQRLVTHADALGISLFEAMDDPDAAGLGTAAVKAVRGFHTIMLSLQSAAQELEVDELVEAVLTRSGTLEALEAERTIEARGRIENLEELVGVAREFRAEREEPTLAVVPAGDLARLRPGHDGRQGVARDADDDPQREGARVPLRLPDRDGGGDLPALALDRGQRDRGGAAARLRRHDARDGEADADARDGPFALRAARVQPRLALPRRAARRRRARAAAADVVVELRLRPRSCAGRRPRRASPRTSRLSRPATPSGTAPSARAS